MSNLVFVFFVCFVSFVVVNAAQNNYCKLCRDHTVCLRGNCGPGRDCGYTYKPIALSNSDRQLILKLHNELRNKVANGQESKNKQPPASNMKTLTYSNELAHIAQCSTNSCKYGHDKCRKTGKYGWVGQNIGTIKYKGTTGNYQSVMSSIINSWYSEVKDFKPSWISRSGSQGNANVGHYTQMVWAETKEIGCGMTYYVSGGWNTYFFACNYGSGGNVSPLPVYKVGRPASACKSRNRQYSGLCS